MRKDDELRGIQKDPRGVVYDLLGNLTEAGIPYAKKLFVMGGQRGMANGYFFDKDSAEYLRRVTDVPLFDESGSFVGTIHREEAFRARFFNEMPKSLVLEGNKKYLLGQPEVPEEERETLWKMRAAILERLRNEGLKASREFLVVGRAMGGEEEKVDDIIQDIGSRVDKLLEQVKKTKK